MDRIREVFTCDPVLFGSNCCGGSRRSMYLPYWTAVAMMYGPPAFDMLCGAGMASAISGSRRAFQALESFAATGDWFSGI